MASMSSLTVNVRLTVNGRAVSRRRLHLLGWILRVLRIPFSVEADAPVAS